MTENTTEEPADEQVVEQEVPPTPADLHPVDEPQESVVDEPERHDEGPSTFSRDYVEKLRKQSAGYRVRAQQSDDLAAALWAARVAATGRLADPSDLPMPEDADPMDAEAVTAAVDELLVDKPHLATRKVTGDVGQGSRGNPSGTVDLAAILRSRAG